MLCSLLLIQVCFCTCSISTPSTCTDTLSKNADSRSKQLICKHFQGSDPIHCTYSASYWLFDSLLVIFIVGCALTSRSRRSARKYGSYNCFIYYFHSIGTAAYAVMHIRRSRFSFKRSSCRALIYNLH